MINTTVRALPILLVLLGLSACSHDERPAAHSGDAVSAPAASAPARELSSAVDELTEARCDLEARCNNIGADEDYTDREACESKLRGSISNDLNTNDCPSGIADSKLSACLSEIKAEDCGDPIEAMSRWASCRSSEICAD